MHSWRHHRRRPEGDLWATRKHRQRLRQDKWQRTLCLCEIRYHGRSSGRLGVQWTRIQGEKHEGSTRQAKGTSNWSKTLPQMSTTWPHRKILSRWRRKQPREAQEEQRRDGFRGSRAKTQHQKCCNFGDGWWLEEPLWKIWQHHWRQDHRQGHLQVRLCFLWHTWGGNQRFGGKWDWTLRLVPQCFICQAKKTQRRRSRRQQGLPQMSKRGSLCKIMPGCWGGDGEWGWGKTCKEVTFSFSFWFTQTKSQTLEITFMLWFGRQESRSKWGDRSRSEPRSGASNSCDKFWVRSDKRWPENPFRALWKRYRLLLQGGWKGDVWFCRLWYHWRGAESTWVQWEWISGSRVESWVCQAKTTKRRSKNLSQMSARGSFCQRVSQWRKQRWQKREETQIMLQMS